MKFYFAWLSPALSLCASLPRHVHIWRAGLTNPQLLSLSDQILTDDEKKRANSITSLEQRHRFKATRACLRDVLSRYLQCTQPQDVLFDRTARGKPLLVRPSSDIHFNLSHTENMLLIAVALTQVGVDVERQDRPLRNLSALLRSRLSRLERLHIQNLSESVSPDERDELIRKEFLKTWTRKEAFVKSTGDGIAKGFRSIEIVERAATLVVQDISSGIPLSKNGLKDFSPDTAHFGAVSLASEEPYELVLMQYRCRDLQT